MQATKTRVLFVDDEPQILKLLELMLKSLQDEWQMEFTNSAAEALERMSKQPFDVLITDMRMPVTSGLELLNKVMRLYPQTVRIILSGYADQEMVLRSIGATHLYLTKPVDPQMLKSTLFRIRQLNDRFLNSKIRSLVTELGRLPTIPAIYFEVMNALQSASVSSFEIGEIVAKDPGLTAKVLQLANSAFFGSASNVSNPEEAVQFLGVGIIAALALTHQLFASLEPQKFHDFKVEKLWQHSIQTGLMARGIAWLQSRNAKLAELSFTAGLLHDVGKLILIDNLPDSYRIVFLKAAQGKTKLIQLEKSEYNVDHADVGGYLLGLWGLSMPLVEAVNYHHQPNISMDQEFTSLTAVHVANVFAQETVGQARKPNLGLLDAPYLSRLGMMDRVKDWQTELMPVR
jgi:HD-like signal output (HDOD) protein